MDIRRWEITDRWGEDGISGEEPDGDWVLYDDHERVVRALQEEIERLKAWNRVSVEIKPAGARVADHVLDLTRPTRRGYGTVVWSGE